MPFNANFILTIQFVITAKSHEHVGRFCSNVYTKLDHPYRIHPKHTHCDRLQRKNHTHEETGREGWEVFGEELRELIERVDRWVTPIDVGRPVLRVTVFRLAQWVGV